MRVGAVAGRERARAAWALVPDLTLGLPLLSLTSLAAFHLSQATLDGAPSWPRLVALGAVITATLALVALPRRQPAHRAAPATGESLTGLSRRTHRRAGP